MSRQPGAKSENGKSVTVFERRFNHLAGKTVTSLPIWPRRQSGNDLHAAWELRSCAACVVVIVSVGPGLPAPLSTLVLRNLSLKEQSGESIEYAHVLSPRVTLASQSLLQRKGAVR